MTVSVNQMAEHLQIATSMESELYTHRQLYNKIKQRVDKLNSTKYFTDTDHLQYEIMSEANAYKKKHLSKGVKIFIILCILSCPIALLTLSSSLSSTEMLQQVSGWILSFGLWFVIIVVILVIKRKNANAKLKEDRQNIDRRLDNSNKLKQKNELIIKDYNVQLNAIAKSYNRIHQDLINLYSENILPEKYRNFPAVATMYQWLDIGICTKLYGHGGLYDRYENYLMQNQIISRLDDINSKLDLVIENQRCLYDEVKRGNEIAEKTYRSVTNIENNTDKMARDIRDIRTNTSITAMNSEHQLRLQQYAMYRARYY